MSYRLITNATLTIVSTTGDKSEREVQVRAYPSPKRDATGAITIDGAESTFKRTGGKGRGTADNRYMYAVVKGESAFWPITEAEATAAVGGKVTLTSIAKAEPAKPEAPKAEPAKAPEAPKAERKNKAKATA